MSVELLLASGSGQRFVEAGLIIFFLIFVGIVVWALAGRADRFDKASRIPLSDHPVTTDDDRAKDATS